MEKLNKLAKTIRIITVAPIMAFVALSILYIIKPDIFQNNLNYRLSVLFLTVLPLLAYPLQPFVPGFRHKGREGQRNLAIIMAVTGYLGGIISALCMHMPNAVWLIYLTYFLSGLGILFFNKVLKIRASGHACGVVGPFSLINYFIGAKTFLIAAILIPVYWACLKLKRHTLPQLVLGSLIPVFALITIVLSTN